jgi:hypothetical protein
VAVPEFTISLGNGLYLDSNGNFTTKTPQGKPAYSTPGFSLPVKPETLEKVLSGISKALPDGSPEARTKLGRLGVPDDAIKFLSQIQSLATSLGKVVPYLGAAIMVAEWLGILKNGPDAITTLVTQRFNDLETLYRTGEDQIRRRYMGDHLDVLRQALNAVSEANEEVLQYNPGPDRLEQITQDMRTHYNASAEAIRNLLRDDTWTISFNSTDYQSVWPWAANSLRFYPKDQPLGVPATLPPQNTNRFDYRLAAPISFAAIQMYLTLIKAISPEYRTTGEFDRDLRDFAQAVDERLLQMHNEVFARTHYDAYQFSGPYFEPAVTVGGIPLIAETVRFSDQFQGYAVGAFDVDQHTDSFYAQQSVIDGAAAAGQPTKKAAMNMRWIPPAVFIKEPSYLDENAYQYRVINIEDCAAAANAQAEDDYADLLYSSGYLSLLHVSGLLRHLSTEPDRSETVRGIVTSNRGVQPDQPAIARSENIALTGVITSPATMTPVEITDRARITTQPTVARQRHVNYRVVLKTFPLDTTSGVANTPYRQQYWTEYMDAPDLGPGANKRLKINSGGELDRSVIAESVSPSSLLTKEGDIEMQAGTYDWYIPEKSSSPISVTAPVEEGPWWQYAALLADAEQEDTGATAIFMPAFSAGDNGIIETATLPQFSNGRILTNTRTLISHYDADLYGDLMWDDIEKNFKGQRRHPKHETVKLHYKLEWQGDSLIVTLDGRPEDRNYQVYVVLEEELAKDAQGNRRFLHSAFPAQFNNQLTYVPQDFFDRERAALIKAIKGIKDLVHQYMDLEAHPREPGPVEIAIHPGDFENPVAQLRIYEELLEKAPDLVQTLLQTPEYSAEI